MNTYVYSAKNNAFFPVAMLEKYQDSGWYLDDLVDISDDVAKDYMGDVPNGKIRAADKKGFPIWIDSPPPTHDELVSEANITRQHLIDQANDLMNSKQWPGKAAIGRLKGDELIEYGLWLDYLDALEAVDTSSAPEITWPDPPLQQV